MAEEGKEERTRAGKDRQRDKRNKREPRRTGVQRISAYFNAFFQPSKSPSLQVLVCMCVRICVCRDVVTASSNLTCLFNSTE